MAEKRTERAYLRLTPREKEALNQILKIRKISLSDYLMNKVWDDWREFGIDEDKKQVNPDD